MSALPFSAPTGGAGAETRLPTLFGPAFNRVRGLGPSAGLAAGERVRRAAARGRAGRLASQAAREGRGRRAGEAVTGRTDVFR